jgi:Kef-type K+ transport system membrane component KefB
MLSQLRTLTDTEMMWAVGAVVGILLAAFFGFLIGRAKDRPVVGLVLGGVLAIPGLIAISMMSKKEPAYY